MAASDQPTQAPKVPLEMTRGEESLAERSKKSVWHVPPMIMFSRLLCQGSCGFKQNGNEAEQQYDNYLTSCVQTLLDSCGIDVIVQVVTGLSSEFRPIRDEGIIKTVALCGVKADQPVAVLQHFNAVIRTPTHLFQFLKYTQKYSSNKKNFSKPVMKAVCAWYNQFAEKPLKLAELATKYRSREGWSHKDVIRKVHLKADIRIQPIVTYLLKGLEFAKGQTENPTEEVQQIFEYLEAVELVKKDTGMSTIAKVIEEHRLSWEHIPGPLQSTTEVFEALLHTMPIMALIRHLGKLATLGIIDTDSDGEKIVCSRLINVDTEHIRLHPFNVLVGLLAYQKGQRMGGPRTNTDVISSSSRQEAPMEAAPGSSSSTSEAPVKRAHDSDTHTGSSLSHKRKEWDPNPNVTDALEHLYNKLFPKATGNGKSYCAVIDVGGLMEKDGMYASFGLIPRVLASALCYQMCLVEKHTTVVLCMKGDVQIVTPEEATSLTGFIDRVRSLKSSPSDLAAPILKAAEEKEQFDAFVLFTCNESRSEETSVSRAMERYRKEMGRTEVKLVDCAMTVNEYTVCDPDDPGSLNVSALDKRYLNEIMEFVHRE